MLLQRVVEGVLVLAFLGHFMVWIFTPTNFWGENLFPALNAHTDSKYYGLQGPIVLVYTLPIIFTAVLGCVYLHLKANDRSNRAKDEKKYFISAWRKPMIVRGPLGVVSAMELLFLLLFLALVIWVFSVYLSISFRKINKGVVDDSTTAIRWQQKLERTGVFLGIAGNVCCAFLFYPVTRGSSILPLLGLTCEGSIKYHIWLGHLAMFFFTAHGVAYILYWAVTHNMGEVLKWNDTGISNVAGELSLLFGLAIWVTVLPRLRRKKFELFFYAHQLYALFMFFYILHVGFIFFCTILPGFYLFLVDRYLRFLQSRRRVQLVSARILPCQTLELNFSKSQGLNYAPTSIVFINIPAISSMQWHPFTVNSNSSLEPDMLSIIIKKEGSWTQKLYETLASQPTVDQLKVSLEGPYGPISVDFLRYDTLVMVAGGSGIASMISIIRELIFAKASLHHPTPCIVLICAFKHSPDLAMLRLLRPIGRTTVDIPPLQIKIKAFVTRDKQPAAYEKSLVRTVWCKCCPSGVPIAGVLGSHGWLCLGAIISASFAVFVIITGLIGRCYIYPIDKNTYKVYSYSARAGLNMLVVSVAIIVVGSVGFVWSKREPVQNLEAGAPATAPSSYNAERELDSPRHQSLEQNTQVQFGSRPNLKKMLLEYEASGSGVLVSGPKEMRHEVAAICSSANNLHFEAISFNWYDVIASM